jgi:hypothetical protein
MGSKTTTMSEIIIEVSAVIEATPKDVYSVLKDYPGGHHAILPKDYFTGLSMIEGGQGGGTVIDVSMNVMGIKSHIRFYITEPEPGRVLMETDDVAGIVTTFTVDPVNVEERSRATIATRSRVSEGLRGIMERLVNPVIMRRIYRQELQTLANYVLKGAT